MRERRPRPGGEVLQAGADGEDHVGLGGKRVGRGRADNPDGAAMDGIVVGERALAGDRLDHGNPALGRKRRNRLLSAGIAHAAARDDERLLRRLQKRGGLGHPVAVGARARDRPDLLLEERRGVVEGEFLGVLGKRDEGRAAVARIQHGGDGLRHRRDDLRRVGDPVPVARDRLEGVVHGGGGVAEVLDLLEHRIGQPVRERIARENQDRQAVGMGRARSRHHVERAGADRGRGDHDLATALGLGVADGGQRHGLLVLAAPGRQPVLDRFQRFREAGDVTVTEDREHTGEERNALAVNDGVLVANIADQGLRHRQPYRVSLHCSPLRGNAIPPGLAISY